ncbi:septum formation protein [Cyclobacterium lianum]|uniref:Nucleoside triphosphate pyrophosphatase n=1 Tax=Cyclobacterium lianum TaxID=388280 RepID=A0A1M7QIC3_9BACT|nr:septum formation protein [Cyclobacterium lianum]
MGIPFSIKTLDTDESFPEDLDKSLVAGFLAKKKAMALQVLLDEHDLLITADTTVIVNECILNKPADEEQARAMLEQIQGRSHKVVTAVCITEGSHTTVFSDTTQVSFSALDSTEISHYIQSSRPFDKAGAYGIQDWIGLIGIESINGSYYTVMGLPIHRLYAHLKSNFSIEY